MSAPTVPARPARSPNRAAAPQAAGDMPRVPPRPQRASAATQSQEREAYARSPLNDTGFSANGNGETRIANKLGEEELKRPPSVASLPMVGQEGMEYAHLSNPQVAAVQRAAAASSRPKDPHETRNVGDDLPLHAPKASASPMTQKTRVAAVTRTDSEKAAVAGVGKPHTDCIAPDRPSSSGHYRPSSAVSTERPASSQAMPENEEHGIPRFGSTIPLYPNAGDVQAPTPGPGSAGLTPHDLSRPGTTDGRRRSAHGFHGPPGSYGLHGHGHLAQDQFERAWYEKHPEELAKEEEYIHHPAAHDVKPAWAMSSDELNKLVHDTGRSASGSGSIPEFAGAPSEVIGYQTSEEYTSRDATPQPTSPRVKPRTSRPSSSSYADSPLKKTFSAQDMSQRSEVMASESSDNGGIPTQSLDPTSGNTNELGGYINEHGENVPILAADEIAKYPGAGWMKPAVSPSQQLTEDEYFSAADNDASPHHHMGHGRSRSKGHSRPSSMHSSSGLSRFNTHEEGTGTPLEEIDEYEPLFDDDEKDDAKASKAPTAKRPPTLKQQHFPSRDIWEDTPDSLNLVTTVDTPEPTAPASATTKKPAAVFESPEAERQRQGEFTEEQRKAAVQDPSTGLAKPRFNAGVQEDVRGSRPGMRQRFPSRDIWEDTPDSAYLSATIGEQEAADAAPKSPPKPAQQPSIPARPARSKPESKAEAPSVPARPQPRDIPVIPERPKPSVPQRPARTLNKEPSDPSPLAKTSSAESATSPDGTSAAASKPKPAPPARPSGSSKLASIKAGFMNDLNSRLQKGAPPPKPQHEEVPKEEEQEKAPLGDARKGRARGPARRKPAASPAPAAEPTASGASLGIASPWTVWSVDTDKLDNLHVSSGLVSKPSVPKPSAATTSSAAQLGERPTSSPLSTNTAGEFLQPRSESPAVTQGALAHAPSPAMDARAHRESAAAKERLRVLEGERIGFESDVPEPVVDQPLESQPELSSSQVEGGKGFAADISKKAELAPQQHDTETPTRDVGESHIDPQAGGSKEVEQQIRGPEAVVDEAESSKAEELKDMHANMRTAEATENGRQTAQPEPQQHDTETPTRDVGKSNIDPQAGGSKEVEQQVCGPEAVLDEAESSKAEELKDMHANMRTAETTENER